MRAFSSSRALVVSLAFLLAASCGDDDDPSAEPDGSSPLGDATPRDTGPRDLGPDDDDASTPMDAGARDSGARDSGPDDDDAAMDAAPSIDGATVDGSTPLEDAGTTDDSAIPTTDGGLDPVAHGAALYTRYCALCHGASAEGYAADHAPAIGNADFLAIATDVFLERAIADGRPGTPMSAWAVEHAGPLAPADVADLVAYLRSLATLPAIDVSAVVVTGDAVHGASLYTAECTRCHGVMGEGDTALSLNHPIFQATASDGFLRHTIEHGRRDTDMSAFGGSLGATDLDDLVAHLRTLRRSDTPPDWPIEPVPTLEDLVLNPDGDAPSFELRAGRYVPAIVLKAALDAGQRVILLDARATSDWMAGHIPGAAPFPFYDIEMLAGSLPNDGTWIVAYCACPHAASDRVVDTLRARGFANTAVLDEGIFFWRDQGYPMAMGSL